MYLTPLQSTVESLANNLLQWPEVLGLVVLALAAWIVWQRTRDDADPSGNLALESDTGSLSILISGAYWVGALAVVAVALMWSTLEQFPMLAAVPVGLVAVAWWLEKQEAMG